MRISTSRKARRFGLGGFLAAAAALMLGVLTPQQQSVQPGFNKLGNRGQQAYYQHLGQPPADLVVALQQLGDEPGRAQQAIW